MATRRERVILELEDSFSSEMARAAAATALLRNALDGLDGTSVQSSRVTQRLTKDQDQLGQTMVRTSNAISKAERPVIRMTGHMQMMADVAAILGPAFVPVGALAVPAVSGLANQLGVAALAAGTAVLAFQGVGDAVTAVNDFALEPTQQNLDKAREAMDKLSPAAGRFVAQIQDMRPAFAGLRDAAAEGLFPGLSDGLDALETRLPDVERIIGNVSETLGQMMSGAGHSFASGRWDEMFDYLATDASDTLASLGRTVGDLTHGLGAMWVAMDPVNDDFNRWLEGVAQSFDQWAQGLSTNQGFQEFVDYLRETGPQVASSMRAVGAAFRDIVEAAAPLGGPALAALEGVSKAISAIADSDMGTPLLAAASAMALFNRAMSVGQGLMGTKMVQNLAGSTAALTAMSKAQGDATKSTTAMVGAQDRAVKSATGVRGAYRNLAAAQQELTRAQQAQTQAGAGVRSAHLAGFVPRQDQIQAVRNYSAARLDVADAERKVATAQREAHASLRSTMATTAKAAGLVGGFGVVASGAADDIGLTNTAMMTLMGTMMAPGVGTAVGALAGGLMDVTAANDNVMESMRTAQSQFASATTFADMQAQIQGADAAFRDFDSSMSDFSWDKVLNPTKSFSIIKNSIEGLFGKSDVEEAREPLREMQREFVALEEASKDLAIGLGADTQAWSADLSSATFGAIGNVEGIAVATEDMEASMLSAQPAMANLGYTMEDLANASGAERQTMIGQIADEITRMDSAQGQLDDLAGSLLNLDSNLYSTAASAQQFSTALGTILAPKFNLSAMTDQFHLSLNTLDEQLSETTKSLKGMGDGAIQNRSAIRGLADNLTQMLTAQAEAGMGSQKLSRNLRDGVAQIVATGRAAGMSTVEVRGYLRQLGLTPKMINTLVKVDTKAAMGNLAQVGGRLGQVDKQTANPKIQVGGVAASIAGANSVSGAMRKTDGTNANPNISVGGVASAVAGANAVSGAISRINSKSVTITTYFRTVGRPSAGLGGSGIGADGMTVPQGFADGGTLWNPLQNLRGTVPGQRAPYGDKVHAFLAPGEEVISNRHGQADRHRDLLKAINANSFADGGMTGSTFRSSRNTLQQGYGFDGRAMKQFEDGIVGMGGSLKATIKELERERDARKKNRDALKQQTDAVKSAIRDRLSEGRWDSIDPWAANSPISARNDLLRGEIIRGRELTADINRLNRILGPKAAAEIIKGASLDEIDAFANSSRKDLLEYQRLLAQANRVSSRAQRAGGEATWAPALRTQNRLLQRQNEQLRSMNKKLDIANKQRESGNKDRKGQPKAISGVINGTARTGARNKR